MKLGLLVAVAAAVFASLIANEARAICEPCVDDAECLGPNGVCFFIEADAGDFCTNSCAGSEDCPAGHTCEDAGGGMFLCLPDTDSCICDGTDLTLMKECQLSDPFDPQRVCIGEQQCTAIGWGLCEPPAEICVDGVDNNCNGAVDEQPCVDPPPPAVPATPSGRVATIVIVGAMIGAVYFVRRERLRAVEGPL